jgi:branched-chain amino acid transport system permease protein
MSAAGNATHQTVRAAMNPAVGGGLSGFVAHWHRQLGILGTVLLLAVVSQVLMQGGFYSGLLIQILVMGIAAMGLDFLAGYAGLVSLGQAGYVGLGAYGVAIAEQHGFGPWTSVLLSLLVVLAVGLVCGVLAVRVSGIGFVIITLALGQIMWGVAFRWVSLSGGDNGLAITQAPVLGPLDFSDSTTQAFGVLAVFILSAVILRVFVASPFGLSLRGIKSNEPRLKTLGYHTRLHRYIGYVVSVFFGGVAGVLFAFTNGLISPTAMDFSHSGLITLMVVLGGLGTLWGPALGSAIILAFQQWLSIYFSRWATVMGALFVAVVIFAPDGIWGVLRKCGRKLLDRHRLAASGSPAPSAADGNDPVDGDRDAVASMQKAQVQP